MSRRPEVNFPFETYARDRNISFTGRLAEVLERLDPDAKKVDHVWGAARVIRAAIERPLEADNRVEAIAHAANFALAVYKGEWDNVRAMKPIVMQQIGNVAIHQEPDTVSRDASTAHNAQGNAHRIRSQFPDVGLLLGLSHGANASLPMTALYLGELPIYCARLSRRKCLDKTPYVSFKEIQYMQSLARDKPVVIIEEDTYSGDTMSAACRYFSRVFDGPVFGAANDDHRTPATIALQGRNWENISLHAGR